MGKLQEAFIAKPILGVFSLAECEPEEAPTSEELQSAHVEVSDKIKKLGAYCTDHF